MNPTLQQLLQAATRLAQSGQLKEATEAIQRALNGVAPRPRPVVPAQAHDLNVLDGCVFEVETEQAPAERADPPGVQKTADPHVKSQAQPQPQAQARAPRPDPQDRPWARANNPPQSPRWHAGPGGTPAAARSHTLYVPPNIDARQLLPLVVMLHGCTQDANDFAAGTGMNERARERGFYVLYPTQSQAANPQRCWNWFKPSHQQRGSGEPAWIANLTREVIAGHNIDPHRVYIAGLSAGGAMASIVADAYPDIFAAAGVHSGLPCGAVSNAAQALALMKTGVATAHPHLWTRRSGRTHSASFAAFAPDWNAAHAPGSAFSPAVAPVSPASSPVPTIVFHGDQDHTVHPRNGEQVVAVALLRAGTPGGAGGAAPASAAHPPVRQRTEQGVSRHGRRYTRSIYYDSAHDNIADTAVAEHWVIHGAGHAWAGGHAQGSYTDPTGPDATLEMLRFFFEHPHAAQRVR